MLSTGTQENKVMENQHDDTPDVPRAPRRTRCEFCLPPAITARVGEFPAVCHYHSYLQNQPTSFPEAWLLYQKLHGAAADLYEALEYAVQEFRFMDEPQRRDFLFAAFADSFDIERLESALAKARGEELPTGDAIHGYTGD
jgi:hypothetical protein